mmetsp:Transcript_52645/g.171163  ORF Transcript_52645/g.171163 Transcript_52645/m.171163 type:complete len:386 (+) Transcript_52645:78-1235(+)
MYPSVTHRPASQRLGIVPKGLEHQRFHTVRYGVCNREGLLGLQLRHLNARYGLHQPRGRANEATFPLLEVADVRALEAHGDTLLRRSLQDDLPHGARQNEIVGRREQGAVGRHREEVCLQSFCDLAVLVEHQDLVHAGLLLKNFEPLPRADPLHVLDRRVVSICAVCLHINHRRRRGHRLHIGVDIKTSFFGRVRPHGVDGEKHGHLVLRQFVEVAERLQGRADLLPQQRLQPSGTLGAQKGPRARTNLGCSSIGARFFKLPRPNGGRGIVQPRAVHGELKDGSPVDCSRGRVCASIILQQLRFGEPKLRGLAIPHKHRCSICEAHAGAAPPQQQGRSPQQGQRPSLFVACRLFGTTSHGAAAGGSQQPVPATCGKHDAAARKDG